MYGAVFDHSSKKYNNRIYPVMQFKFIIIMFQQIQFILTLYEGFFYASFSMKVSLNISILLEHVKRQKSKMSIKSSVRTL